MKGEIAMTGIYEKIIRELKEHIHELEIKLDGDSLSCMVQLGMIYPKLWFIMWNH